MACALFQKKAVWSAKDRASAIYYNRLKARGLLRMDKSVLHNSEQASVFAVIVIHFGPFLLSYYFQAGVFGHQLFDTGALKSDRYH
jgi:hypothetical protein